MKILEGYMTDTIQRAKEALWVRYQMLNPKRLIDAKGYIQSSELNLLQPEWMGLIIEDYKKGGGKELDQKFRAVHSSAALVANHFARFKNEPCQLIIGPQRTFGIPIFEKQLPTGLRGTPPNLDVFFENGNTCIAIESKLLETLLPKKPHFSPSYSKDLLPYCEPQWWDLIESASDASEEYLDVAQLVKHYLGLIYYVKKNRIGKKPILMYLYWKPENAKEIHEYQRQDQEVEKFKNKVAGTSVDFVSMSYPELWEAWSREPNLAEHASKLTERYSVKI
jgi:hypothetical protein